MVLSQQSSSFSSSTSSQQQMSSNGSTSRLPLPSNASPSLSHSSSFTSTSTLAQSSSVLAPIASRVRERDADAIAEYKKRNRSGSAGTQQSNGSKIQSNGSGSISTLSTINGSNSHLPLTSPPNTSTPPSALANRRLLRPSASAAQLRSPPPVPISTSTIELHHPRTRSGTQPTASRPANSLVASPTEGYFPPIGNPPTARPVERKTSSSRRTGSTTGGRPSDVAGGDFTGPPSDYAKFPDPPPNDAQAPTPPPASSKPSNRRTGFALLSKPLPSIESRNQQRDHRRGGSATSVSEVRN